MGEEVKADIKRREVKIFLMANPKIGIEGKEKGIQKGDGTF